MIKLVTYMNENYRTVESFSSEMSRKKALVFLHGYGANPQLYKKFVDKYQDKYFIYIPSLPAHGNTKLPQWFKAIKAPEELEAKLIDFVSEFVEFHKIKEPFTLVGHSLGGALAIKYSSKYPEKVKKLVVLDNAGFDKRLNWFKRLSGKFKSYWDYVKRARRIPLNSIFFTLKKFGDLKVINKILKQLDVTNDWKNLKVDSYVYWGSKDSVTPIHIFETMKRLNPDAKYQEFEGKNHNWVMYAPELIADAIN